MKVTSIAIEQLSKALENQESTTSGIRVFSQEGCCGPGLQMAIADKASPGDKVITVENVNFFVDDQAEKMLEGVTLDHGSNGFRLEGLKRSGSCC